LEQVVTLSKDAPWWATFIVALIMGAALIIQARGGIRFKKLDSEVKAQAVVVGKVHHQVANEHETNLRDDVDDVKAVAQQAVNAAQSAVAAIGRLETLVIGVMETSRQTDKRLDSTSEQLGGQIGTIAKNLADLSKTLQVHINNQENGNG
jgi:hypothetical protein